MPASFLNPFDITTYANAAALTAVDTTYLANGMYAAVTDLGIFQLNKESTSTVDGSTVIAGDKTTVTWNVMYGMHLLLNNSSEIDGSQVATFASVSLADGTAAAPSLTFTDDQNTGLYLGGANTIGFAGNGAMTATLSPTALVLNTGVQISAPVGSAAAPSLAFTGDLDTGVYHPAANQVGVAVNGALVTTFAASVVTLASGTGLTLTSGALTLTAGSITLTSGNLTFTSGRLLQKQGANVASANNITLGSDGNFFLITGTTTINTIAATNWQAGSVIYLTFNGSLVVKNLTAGTGAQLLLASSTDFPATANDTMSLIYNGTNWVEISRTII